MYGYDFEFGRGSPGWRGWTGYDEELRGAGRAMGWTGGPSGDRFGGRGGQSPRARPGGGYPRVRGVYGEDYPTFGGYPGGQGGIHYGGRTPGGFSGGGLRGGGRRFGGRGGMGSGGEDAYGRGGTGGFSGGYTGGGSAGGYSGRGPGAGGGLGGAYGGGYAGGSYTASGDAGGRYGGGGYGGRFGGEGAGHGFGPGFGPGGASGEPFLPEDAYRRHPELDRPPHGHRGGRWPEGSGTMDLEDYDDSDIEGAVREMLHRDRWLTTSEIEVEVSDGVVTLRGEVSDYMEARYAWDDAWETEGVRGVVNQLTVRTDQPATEHGDVLPQSSGTKKGRKGSSSS